MFHTVTLTPFGSIVNYPVLRKSYITTLVSDKIVQGDISVVQSSQGQSLINASINGDVLGPGAAKGEEAILQGQGAIAQGPGAIAATGAESIAIGSVDGDVMVTGNKEDITGRDLVIHNVAIPYNVAFEKIAYSTISVLHQLEEIYTQAREQSQGWFRFSLMAAGVGFILIGIGVIAVIFGHVTAGLITSFSSAIPNVVAALFFLQSKAANERVDAIQTKLTEARKVQTAVEIANTISDRKSRDKLKAEIVRTTLQMEKKSNLREKAG